jgi:hypothetical protein
MERKASQFLSWILLGVIFLTCCTARLNSNPTQSTLSPTEILASTPIVTPIPIQVFVDPRLPVDFRDQLVSSSEIKFVETSPESQVQLTFSDASSKLNWVYVLVAPFPIVMDEVDLADLKKAWSGDFSANSITKPILMTDETRNIFSILWGEPAEQGVKILVIDNLQNQAWNDFPNWAIVPFEELNPKWKVLEVDGKSPLAKDFSILDYPLGVQMDFQGDENVIRQLDDLLESNPTLIKLSNRDASLLSVVMLTGTTALTRDIGKQMDAKGILYPASDIMEWFLQADIIHISNEVSFMDGCDLRDRIKFCAKPEFLGLLTGIGANVIELTGNHLLDYGEAPFLFSLDLYRQQQIPYYGGGANLEEARMPLLIEDHGNKIAFLGCNYGFPESAMATDTSPGVNPCNRDWMQSAIQDLKDEGYLVIFTFQNMESCTIEPLTSQRGDFFRAAEAGADIVSGSQSHCPQTMTFHQGAFVHFGLGNFFFDQMSPLEQREMIDLHYFNNGRYISTQFLTGILEDSSKPRPMTIAERENLLYQIFEYSVWEK